ncbi:MAG: alpha/beta hydrolase [Myxococcota bacterium]
MWIVWLACTARLPSSYAEIETWSARPVEGVTEDWWSWRGHDVHLDVHAPDGETLGTVLLVHGGGGHGRILAPFAVPLREAGYRVVAPDLPGYGLTVVPRGARTGLGDWSALVADLAQAQGDTPVTVLGMSVGGTVALHAAMQTTAIDAVVVTTLLDLQDPEVLRAVARRPGSVGLLRRFGGVVGGLRWRVRRLAPLDDLSSDPAIVEALVDDPLVGRRRVPLRFFASFLDTSAPVAPTDYERPVLVVHPAEDSWTPPALSRPTYDALPGDKAWVALEGASHLPLEQPGFGRLVEATLDWLARYASR